MKRKANVTKVKVGSVTVRIYARSRKTVGGGERTVFELADYSTGVRRLRGFSDEAEAVREARRIAGQLSTGNAEAARMMGHEAASYTRAIELLRQTGDTLETACDRYANAVKVLGDGARLIEAVRDFNKRNPATLPSKTVTKASEELQEALKADASKRYLGDLKYRLKKFSDAFQTDIGSITAGDIQRWLDGLDCGKQSRLNFRRVVGRLFAFAKSRGYVTDNPTKELERIKVKSTSAVSIYTPAEVAKLLKAAADDFLPALAVAAFAGLRSAEIVRLDWADIKLDDRHIVVEAAKAKTASRRIVPIAPNLCAWLKPHAKAKGRVWAKTERKLYTRQQETANTAGVEWKQNALRHSFISYRLAEVQDAAKVSLEAGNSPQMVFRHYREVVRPKDGAAWFSVSPEAPANLVQLKTA